MGKIGNDWESDIPYLDFDRPKSRWILDTGVDRSYTSRSEGVYPHLGFEMLPWEQLVGSHRNEWAGLRDSVDGVIGGDLFLKEGLVFDLQNGRIYTELAKVNRHYYLPVREGVGYMIPFGCEGRVFRTRSDVLESGKDFRVPEVESVRVNFETHVDEDSGDTAGYFRVKGTDFLIDTGAMVSVLPFHRWNGIETASDQKTFASGPSIGELEVVLLKDVLLEMVPGRWFELLFAVGEKSEDDLGVGIIGLPFFANNHVTFFASEEYAEMRRYMGARRIERARKSATVYVGASFATLSANPFLFELDAGEEMEFKTPFFVSGSDLDTSITWVDDETAVIRSTVGE